MKANKRAIDTEYANLRKLRRLFLYEPVVIQDPKTESEEWKESNCELACLPPTVLLSILEYASASDTNYAFDFRCVNRTFAAVAHTNPRLFRFEDDVLFVSCAWYSKDLCRWLRKYVLCAMYATWLNTETVARFCNVYASSRDFVWGARKLMSNVLDLLDGSVAKPETIACFVSGQGDSDNDLVEKAKQTSVVTPRVMWVINDTVFPEIVPASVECIIVCN